MPAHPYKAALAQLVGDLPAPTRPLVIETVRNGATWTLSVKPTFDLTECMIDVLLTLHELPAGTPVSGPVLRREMEAAGRVHGVSTFKRDVPSLRCAGYLSFQPALGFELLPAGEAVVLEFFRDAR